MGDHHAHGPYSARSLDFCRIYLVQLRSLGWLYFADADGGDMNRPLRESPTSVKLAILVLIIFAVGLGAIIPWQVSLAFAGFGVFMAAGNRVAAWFINHR